MREKRASGVEGDAREPCPDHSLLEPPMCLEKSLAVEKSLHANMCLDPVGMFPILKFCRKPQTQG